MKNPVLFIITFSALVLRAALNGQENVSYKIIVHPSNPVTAMTKKQISSLFLKKNTRWEGGKLVLPVDLIEGTEVRKAFTKDIHRKKVGSIKAYWTRQVFAGNTIPPLEKTTAEVLRYVRTHPGAIGYVSQSTETGNVKVIQVIE